MLNLLKIKNLALVDSLTWNIGSGLVVVTGETGAGKSVIVGALKLILGERADKGVIRTGEDACKVEAVFDLSAQSPIHKLLEDAGFESEGSTLILKRVVAAGSNKQFVNDSPCTLNFLKTLGKYLVDLHGPHAHQSLLSTDRQLHMLDCYVGADQERASYEALYRKWKESSDKLEAFMQAEGTSEHELDLLRFQVEEIDNANLVPVEESEIEEKYRKYSNSSRLVEHSSVISSTLSSGLVQQLGDIQRAARELEKLDPAAADSFAGLDSAVMELQELEGSIMEYVESIETDPSELMALETRINTFETLKRKYGGSLEAVLLHADSAREKLSGLDNREEKIASLEKDVSEALEELTEVAGELSAKRKKKAPKLAKEVASHLKDLGFKEAAFQIQIEAYTKPHSCGMETVDFQFGPNPGEPLKPLKSIASSGEISRVMLAVKTALAQQDFTPLMVFDEIDANVGGEIARAVGEKMAGLGKSHQVISITHFPQVAAVAGQHYVVQKNVEEGRTVSHLSEVKGQARVDELVRMLGGGTGKEAVKMAKALLA